MKENDKKEDANKEVNIVDGVTLFEVVLLDAGGVTISYPEEFKGVVDFKNLMSDEDLKAIYEITMKVLEKAIPQIKEATGK